MRVLIVDDEPRVREILTRMLAPGGYAIETAADAESALELAAAQAPAVVLCDIEMPGHGGAWLIPRVRQQFPQAAIVLATGVDELPGTLTLQTGVVGYVLKPFRKEQVCRAVSDAVAWHKQAVPASSGPIDEWSGAGCGPSYESARIGTRRV